MPQSEVFTLVQKRLPVPIVNAYIEAAQSQLTGNITVHFRDGVPMVVKTTSEVKLDTEKR